MANKDYYAGQQQYYPPPGVCPVTDCVTPLTRVPGPPPQGGYYPQQPPQSYPGPGGYGGPGYQPQPPPQTVYVCVCALSEFLSD